MREIKVKMQQYKIFNLTKNHFKKLKWRNPNYPRPKHYNKIECSKNVFQYERDVRLIKQNTHTHTHTHTNNIQSETPFMSLCYELGDFSENMYVFKNSI